MMRSPSENCFAPKTSTIFILSVAWIETNEEEIQESWEKRNNFNIQLCSCVAQPCIYLSAINKARMSKKIHFSY